MAYPKETRRKARSLYVHSRQSIPVIGITLDISSGTVSRWKQDAKADGDDWDVARSSAVMAGDGFEKLVSDSVEGFTVMFQVTMEQIRDADNISPLEKAKTMASLADSFNKMINSAGRAAPSLSKLGVASDVLMRFGRFVDKRFPEHSQVFLEILEAFGPEIGKEYHETS